MGGTDDPAEAAGSYLTGSDKSRVESATLLSAWTILRIFYFHLARYDPRKSIISFLYLLEIIFCARALVQKKHRRKLTLSFAAGVGQWKKLSAVATAPVLLYAIYMFFHEEHHKERVEYPYLGLRQHKFPWAEGEREAFGVIGNAIGHHYPQV
jgi:hypothetical protein